MIALQRREEPPVLAQNKAEWLRKYLEKRATKSDARPSHAQYAHDEIVRALESMSFHKCFYCEQSTKSSRPEVDHHVDVAVAPERAFDWDNLYLACFECNRKKIKSVPAADCIDPCDASCDPADHLTFEDEFIRSRPDSVRGRSTIQRYRLDRDDLDYKRGRLLRQFSQALLKIKDEMIADGRKVMNDTEEELLSRFRQPDRPFSLMMRVYTDALLR